MTNREYYAEHPKIEEAVHTNTMRYSESMLFSLCLAQLGPSNLKDKANHVTAIVEEVQGKCKLWHKIFFKTLSDPKNTFDGLHEKKMHRVIITNYTV